MIKYWSYLLVICNMLKITEKRTIEKKEIKLDEEMVFSKSVSRFPETKIFNPEQLESRNLQYIKINLSKIKTNSLIIHKKGAPFAVSDQILINVHFLKKKSLSMFKK